jgi:hypothetical protein
VDQLPTVVHTEPTPIAIPDREDDEMEKRLQALKS